MVTKRAAASGVVALVPIPGTDIAADIGMLMELLPAINQRFGLSKEQIDQLDERTKILVIQIAKTTGAQLVGQVITKQLIIEIVKKVAGRFAAKQVIKYTIWDSLKKKNLHRRKKNYWQGYKMYPTASKKSSQIFARIFLSLLQHNSLHCLIHRPNSPMASLSPIVKLTTYFSWSKDYESIKGKSIGTIMQLW